MNATRRTFLVSGAAAITAATLPVTQKAKAQSYRLWPGQMDLSIMGAALAVSSGQYSALRAGWSPMQLNTDDMVGFATGVINQVRYFGGADQYLDYFQGTDLSMDPGTVAGSLSRHVVVTPQMWSDISTVASLPTQWLYDAKAAVGGDWQTLTDYMAGVVQYCQDQQYGYDPLYGWTRRGALTAKAPATLLGTRDRQVKLKRRYESDDPFCDPSYQDCECDPFWFCTPDPLPGYPNPLTGYVLPWVDPASPTAPRPKHGLTKADVCYWAQLGALYLVTIGKAYQIITTRFGGTMLVTLAGELIVETVAVPEVAAALTMAGIALWALTAVTC